MINFLKSIFMIIINFFNENKQLEKSNNLDKETEQLIGKDGLDLEKDLNIHIFFDGSGCNFINTDIAKKAIEKNTFKSEKVEFIKHNDFSNTPEIESSTNINEIEVYPDYVKQVYDNFYSSEKYKYVVDFKENCSKKFTAQGLKGTSYLQDYSNIALMFKAQKSDSKNLSIYISGVGTTSGKSDNLIGLGLANGVTGIDEKVSEAFQILDKICQRIEEQISNREIEKITKPLTIKVNLYGFSRGALIARYFYYEFKEFLIKFSNDCCDITKHKKLYEMALGKKIEFKFDGMCIFETVASEGLIHDNDIKSFHLDECIKDMRVLHITAQDEFRNQYKLVNIPNTTATNNSLEISIPGAHADIGGGYQEYEVERNLSLGKALLVDAITTGYENIHYSWFLNKGYYHLDNEGHFYLKNDNSLNEIIHKNGALVIDNKDVLVQERVVKISYQYAVLYAIIDILRDYFNLDLDRSKLSFDKYVLSDTDLLNYANNLKDWITKQVNYNFGINSRDKVSNSINCNYVESPIDYSCVDYIPNLNGISYSTMREIYRKYIHNSVNNESIANFSKNSCIPFDCVHYGTFGIDKESTSSQQLKDFEKCVLNNSCLRNEEYISQDPVIYQNWTINYRSNYLNSMPKDIAILKKPITFMDLVNNDSSDTEKVCSLMKNKVSHCTEYQKLLLADLCILGSGNILKVSKDLKMYIEDNVKGVCDYLYSRELSSKTLGIDNFLANNSNKEHIEEQITYQNKIKQILLMLKSINGIDYYQICRNK